MNDTTRYAIEITQSVVSYRTQEGVTPSGGRYGGEWMDGDHRELERPDVSTIEADADDLEMFDGSAVDWAANEINCRTSITEASLSPIPDQVPEHCWLSGSYQDPYRGDARVTETSAYLRGDWTPEQRAEVFRKVTGRC